VISDVSEHIIAFSFIARQ